MEHLYYLAELVREAGHEVEFLTCDADLPACYTREIRDIRPDWQECLMCRVGGLRSYSSSDVASVGEYAARGGKVPLRARDWALSSASTLGRFESDEDFESAAFEALVSRLQPTVEMAYTAAVNWIKDKELEGLLVFNGRMDATRAIFEAGIASGISVLTLERTWFGDGLQIRPHENCLGLASVNRMVSEWVDKPLTQTQASVAAGHIASRFLRQNQKEWRAYNVNGSVEPWPIARGRRKILLIPGSRNESWGHPDYATGWDHPIVAYDALIDHFGLQSDDMLLRCHPNWGEKIGKADGHLPEEYYVRWASKRGIKCIPSTSTVSTLGLIEQADAVVVASGSAALEAGALGKQVIGIAPSTYQESGIREDGCDVEKLKSLTLRADMPAHQAERVAEEVRQRTLRFAYTVANRIPQYVDFVKCETTTSYSYKKGGEAGRLIELFQTGILKPDEDTYAEDSTQEARILELMRERRWEELHTHPETTDGYYKVKRRVLFRWIDQVRSRMQRGDR